MQPASATAAVVRRSPSCVKVVPRLRLVVLFEPCKTKLDTLAQGRDVFAAVAPSVKRSHEIRAPTPLCPSRRFSQIDNNVAFKTMPEISSKVSRWRDTPILRVTAGTFVGRS